MLPQIQLLIEFLLRMIKIILMGLAGLLNFNLFTVAKYDPRKAEGFDLRNTCLNLRSICSSAELVIHQWLDYSSQDPILVRVQYG